MLKLLIADGSEAFTDALEAVLKNEFELQICHDGERALETLLSFRPDALILNFMLPYKDGLTVLQQSAHRPKVILAVSPYVNAYIEQVAASVGVQYILIMPTVDSLRVRLMDMVATLSQSKQDPATQSVVLLHTLGFPTHLDGYHQLCAGIPLFAANPNMRLSKELYPQIAAQFHLPDCRTVEHSIRKAIANAWANRDPIVWAKYFPADTACPSNKVFFSRLIEHISL